MKLIHRDREWELEGRMTVRQAIEKIGLIPETVLAVRDGKLLTEDTVLEPGDTVKLVSVVSGG
ncbi:MAG: MoaD/ThiS family protein [Anaerolineae bacterium]